MRRFISAAVVAICGLAVTACVTPEAESSSAAAQSWVDPFPEADAPGAGLDTELEIANKRTVLTFYDAAFNAKDFEAAAPFLSAEYVHHNPDAADGAAGLAAYIARLRDEMPQSHTQVMRVLTDDAHVILHSHLVETPGARGTVVGDIFRLEAGEIVEHWSVFHPITDSPSPDNPNWVF